MRCCEGNEVCLQRGTRLRLAVTVVIVDEIEVILQRKATQLSRVEVVGHRSALCFEKAKGERVAEVVFVRLGGCAAINASDDAKRTIYLKV